MMDDRFAEFERWSEIYPSLTEGNAEAWATRFVWYLRGPKGVVQFMLRLDREGVPEGWDLGYHSPMPNGSGTEFDECEVTNGKCWYDGSGLQAQELLAKIYEVGDSIMWDTMLDRYHYWLEVGSEEAAA